MATYTIPPGLTFKQKKAMAALLACAPCCAGGSGSGNRTGPNYEECCGFCDGLTNVSPPATLNVSSSIDCIGTLTGTMTKTADCIDDLTYTYTSSTLVSGTCDLCYAGIPDAWANAPDLDITLRCRSSTGNSLKWDITSLMYSVTKRANFVTGTCALWTEGLTQGTRYGPDVDGYELIFECSPFYLYVKAPVTCLGGGCAQTDCDGCSDGDFFIVEITE